MIAWILLLLSAIFPALSFAYFGPTVDTDEISTSAEISDSFFLQSVVAKNHFTHGETEPTYLLDETTHQQVEKHVLGENRRQEQLRQLELLNLSWMLGYAYYRSSGHDPTTGNLIADEAHALKLGLAWEAGGIFDLEGAVSYQVMPAENYSQGIFDLNAAYTIPLESEHVETVEGSSQDASVYYQNQELAQNQVSIPAVRRFPNIRIGLRNQIQVHTKSATSGGRTAGSTLTSDQTLNVSVSGPELLFRIDPRLSFRLAAMFYFYSDSPSTLLSDTTIGGNRTKTDIAIADSDGTLPYLLFFPSRTVVGSGTYWFDREVNSSLILEGATYSPTGSAGAGLLTFTFSTGVKIDWVFAPRWKAGVVGDFTVGNNSYGEGTGGVKLGFAL